MISKKFYLNIILRIALLMISFLAILPFIQNLEKLFTSVLILLLIIVQVILLISYINRFNRDLSDFFSCLKTNDISFAFHDKSFPNITSKFRADISYIRTQLFEVRKSIEIQQTYFKTVIENAQTGILTLNKEGKIDIINKSALELLKINSIYNINDLKISHFEFYKKVIDTKAGAKEIVTITNTTETIPLSLRVTQIKQGNDELKIVSFQNIKKELDSNELESWQKLIRVLTHEINNSVSPIISLADSIEKKLKLSNIKAINNIDVTKDTLSIVQDGLHTISERSNGLMQFVNNYKNISSQKNIHKEYFKVAELFYNLELLMQNKLKEKNIELKIDIKPIDLEVEADKKYIEQIFINLIKNSIDAVHVNKGWIMLKAYKALNNKVLLEISDNGIGIPNELENQIFIPFFTTKKNGSGIGLSLARQIINLHGGSINLKQSDNKTIFIIEL